jgi:hypothetical protein
MSIIFKMKLDVTELDLQRTSKLFSENYGVWSKHGIKPNNKICLNSTRLKSQCLFDDNCGLIQYIKDMKLLGHSYFRIFDIDTDNKVGKCICITQLVVSKEHCNQRIATTLLSSLVNSNIITMCMLTSHPYSIKAMECAFGYKCVKDEKFIKYLQKIANIPYFTKGILKINENQCVINTSFYIDHTKTNNYVSTDSNWKLGLLNEGDEFVAVIGNI